jgi:hypothetical protein
MLASSDHADRIKDFLDRHGGPSNRASKTEESAPGVQGWTEVYASDGYILRCDWSCFGNREEMQFSEIPPQLDPSIKRA